MSHELEVVNGVARMIYVGEDPWHKLGKKLETPPASVLEALQAAGMAGWDVSVVQLQLPDGRKVDSYATVRGMDGAVLGEGLGRIYRAYQNEQAFAPADVLIKSGAATIETAGSIYGGRKTWFLAKVSKPSQVIVPGADDTVELYLLIAHSFDGTTNITFLPTGTRVVCRNTLHLAMSGAKRGGMKIRHTGKGADALTAVAESMEKLNADFSKTADMWRALAGKPVNEKQIRAYVDAVFPPQKQTAQAHAPVLDVDTLMKSKKGEHHTFESLLAQPFTVEHRSEIDYAAGAAEQSTRRVADNVIELLETGGKGLDLPGVKGTAWAAYNGMTEYLTWHRGRSDDNRFQNLFFGDVGKRASDAAVATFLK
jgi:phage/plasmid-like protein (TIGR03299 family)